jgi:hypothetical protein
MQMNKPEFHCGKKYGSTSGAELLHYFKRHIEALVAGVSESGVHSFSQSETNKFEPFKTDLIISFQLSTFLLTCIVLVKN